MINYDEDNILLKISIAMGLNKKNIETKVILGEEEKDMSNNTNLNQNISYLKEEYKKYNVPVYKVS